MAVNGTHPLTERLTLRTLQEEEASKVLPLSRAEGWMQTEEDWRHLIRWSDGSTYIALDQETVVGVGAAVPYGPERGRLANIITHPDYRRRGIGNVIVQTLLRDLRKRGISKVDLDSTEQGQTLYERLGFLPSYLIELFMGRPKYSEATPQPGNYEERDWEGLVHLDAEALGVSRSHVLRDLIAENRKHVWVDRRDGAVVGYLIAVPHGTFLKIGPWIHRDASGAQRLLEQALPHAGAGEVRVDVVSPNTDAAALVKDFGLKSTRVCKRMYLGSGGPIQEVPELYFGILHMITG